jgi:UDP-N-acetylglucosamine acyltransferase
MNDLTSDKSDNRGRRIHPTALVHPDADIDTDVVIGPFSVIGPNVTIGKGSRVGAHAVIDGHTTIGENNQFFTGSVIGSQTQDLKYHGGNCRVVIGNDNMIREYATINTSTSEENATRIGNGNLLMTYTHVAHECAVGDGVVMANNATLAGHVTVHDKAILGGLVAVHQFTRIGTLAIVGGCAKVVKDVMPYSMVDGYPARWHGLNFVGLRRNGVPEEIRTKLKKAFKIIYRSNLNMSQAVEKLRAEFNSCPEIDHVIQFIESSSRGVC